jgi:hypothetical protein
MAPRPSVGLRGRLVAALFLTSGLTLAIAALALFAPLEHRLRSEDLENLTEAGLAISPELQDLDRTDISRRSTEFRKLARLLERRTGARVAIFDRSGHKLADTDPDAGPNDVRGGPFDEVAKALETGKRVRDTVNTAGVNVGRVAIPLKSGGTRIVLVLPTYAPRGRMREKS